MISKVGSPFEPETDSSVDCTHCSLPVPAGLIEPNRDTQFCCGGCEAAYDLIHSNGLESFYQKAKTRSSVGSESLVKSAYSFDQFDEPVFQNKYTKRQSESVASIELAVDGIHCGACIWLIEKLPCIEPGVISATANWRRRTVRVCWKTDEVPLSRIAKTLSQLGYRPSPIQPNQALARWQQANRRHLTQIGIAAACAGNNMIISAALYLGMFAHMTPAMAGMLRTASGVVGLFALAWPGRVFLKSAISAIRTRTPHMDLPIALGLTVGTIAGIVNVVRGVGEIYFDSLSVLIFLLLIGRWIQFRQQSKAADAIELLYRLTPQTTRKLVDGQPVETLVDLVEVDDLLDIRPGDLFPVDGKIVAGETEVDESILTGESEAIKRVGGDAISAGTKNKTSPVVVRAGAIGQDTRLSSIVGLVEQASSSKPAIVMWANKVGGYFVTVVIILSVFTFLFWSFTDLEIAIDRTIALLIVACPCALALATPLAIAVALGRAANQKIMIKGGDTLQLLRQPGTIWLDKTGTLTKGDLYVAQWYGNLRNVKLAAALENKSTHPVARAIVNFSETNPFNEEDEFAVRHRSFHAGLRADYDQSVFSSESIDGLGIKGKVGDRVITVGNHKLMRDSRISTNSQQQRIASRISGRGLSPCWIAIDGDVVGIAAIGDAIREDAVDSIKQLKQKGWRIGVLSGDHQHVVDRVAMRLGIPLANAKGGVEPEEKLAVVQHDARSETVVMVGDGVNDCAALAAADVGIAVKGGAEASLAAAPVYFGTGGVAPLLNLLSISDSASKTMRLNLGVSLAYNICFAALAFAGFINPLVAAILMPISSITVVALSLRSGRGSNRIDSFSKRNQSAIRA